MIMFVHQFIEGILLPRLTALVGMYGGGPCTKKKSLTRPQLADWATLQLIKSVLSWTKEVSVDQLFTLSAL